MKYLVALALVVGLLGCPQTANVLSPGADGGVDAGTLDAGVADSGFSDAGQLDAGVSDAGPADAGPADAGPADAGDVIVHASFTPDALFPDAGDLTNALRGQYLWLGVAPYPAGRTDVDAYSRWNWVDFESSAGNYNWQMIDDQITAAKAHHGRFGMRLMPLCQGCAPHMYQGAHSSIPDDLADVCNPLIASAPGETDLYVLPDWNSDAYLNRLQTTLSAIGARYANEPTLAWVDVSAYGNWGEFHLYPFSTSGGPYDSSTQRPITDANARRIVQMNVAAFAGKLLVVNSEQPAALTEGVATTSMPVGLRVDCLGSDGLAGGQQAIAAATGAIDHWRVAPFITEWCQFNLGSSGADLFVQGEQQVRDFHISMLSSGNFTSDPTSPDELAAFTQANLEAGYRLRTDSVQLDVDREAGSIHVQMHWLDDGVAPAYLAWRPTLVLSGPANVELPMTFDLRQVMPDEPGNADELVQSPIPLPAGDYQVSLRVDDVQGISLPMQLGNLGRTSDGSYPLGTVTLR